MTRVNEHGQRVGPELPGWRPRPFPDLGVLEGRWCRIEAVTPDHAAELFPVLGGRDNAPLWTYSSHGPFADEASLAAFLEERAEDSGTVALVVRDAEGVAGGLANLMAISTEHGSAELGGIVLGHRLQRTTAATEAAYLLLRDVLDLGYRRVEWKCDALNEPSRRAALRLGFTFEGRARNAVVVKGRSRDTDWFSVTDTDWPAVRAALEAWLDPANQPGGRQIRSLAEVRDGPPRAEPATRGLPSRGAVARMDGMAETLTGSQVLEAGLADWRLLLSALHARFRTGGFATGLTLVDAIGRAAEEMNHHPDLDLRYGHLNVTLTSHDVGGVTERDLRLARRISELAAEAGAEADPAAVQTLELALDTADRARVRPFWKAVLGLDDNRAIPNELTDRSGQLPTLWFQQTEAHQEPRQRFHVDVHVPHDQAEARVRAALEAGGTLISDRDAPSFWVLADPEGNKACVCTWQGREQEPA